MRFCEASSLPCVFFLSTRCPAAHTQSFYFSLFVERGEIKRETRTLTHICGSYLQFAAELCCVFTNSASRAPERKVPPSNQY